jgi:hypothetical protein
MTTLGLYLINFVKILSYKDLPNKTIVFTGIVVYSKYASTI